MKKTQRDTYIPSEDFEDLTLFANESFDTQDVDLFEFTGEESSPLTRLKSIILSLDWEINDEILQELADELVSLQGLWQGDKVAEVYLQGLAKIGNYIRTKGAYAHPNSIKLLLTFFYNFEKIISSPTITGDQITQLLKGDVRKFKILQYQIAQSETPVAEEPSVLMPSSPTLEQPALSSEEPTPTQQLKAAILGLDWEVTEESLMQFNATLLTCHQHMTGNKAALVLLQGLQALGDYIAEERAASHPDAFSLLHAFDEALEQVEWGGEDALDHSEIQELLVDRINRLNNLKMVIAAPHSGVMDEHLIAGVVDEISAPPPPAVELPLTLSLEATPKDEHPATTVAAAEQHPADTLALGAELDSIFGLDTAVPAMETADKQYPDEILPADAIHPVDDELADDLIGAELSSKRGLAPALADTEEMSGFHVDEATLDQPTQNDLAAQLDFLFAVGDGETDDELPLESDEAAPAQDVESLSLDFATEPIAALSEVTPGTDTSYQDDELESAAFDLGDDRQTGVDTLDIESKLDSFFADALEEPDQTMITGETVEKIEQTLFFDESTSPAAALADTEEQGGFSEEEAVAALGHSPLDEIEEKLDFFFGDELESGTTDDSTHSFALEVDAGTEPALSDVVLEVEEAEPVAALSDVQPTSELDGALDLFFAEPEAPTATVEALTSAVESGLVAAGLAETEEWQIHLATLGALLPLAVRTLARDQINQSLATLATLQQHGPSGEHRALGQLLQSVLTMLARLPAKDQASTEQLVNYLYEQLRCQPLSPSVLVEAVPRFSTWLHQASSLMPLVPSPAAQTGAESAEPQYHYTAKELYFELAELRLHMHEEFAKIRHELQHHH